MVINYVAENFNSTILHKLDIVFDSAFNYSIITTMEVLGYNGDVEDIDKFEKLFKEGNRLSIDDAVIKETITFGKQLR